MYDARQEPNEFVADSLEETRAKAAAFFDRDEGELKIIVPDDGEIYGVRGRVVITAVPKDAAGRAPSGEGRGRGDDRGPRREARGDRGGDRGGRRERGPRGDRNDRGDRGEGRGRGRRGNGRDRDGDEGRRGSRERAPAEPKRAVADSKGTPSGEISELGEFLLGAVERMKLGSFEISESSEGDYLIFQLRGDAAKALQAGDGRATDALQLVANQVAMRQSEDAPRVVVDVEGGGDEREQTLNRLADRAVKRAQDTGRSVALDPMNSRDRRAVHMAVREIDGVATMSIGEGRYRQVLIVPEGAPEYEDALAESS